MSAGTARPFGRFSPSETQCRAGVSTSSPLCFECVNPPLGTSHLVGPAVVGPGAAERLTFAPPLRSPDRAPDEHPPCPRLSRRRPADPSAGRPHLAGPAPFPTTGSPRCGAPGWRSTTPGRPGSSSASCSPLWRSSRSSFTVIGIHNNHQDRPTPQPGRPGGVDGHVLPGPARGQRQQRGRATRAGAPTSSAAAATTRSSPAPRSMRRAPWSAPSPCPRTRRWSHRSPSSTPEHTSASVFILPAALFVVLVASSSCSPYGRRARSGDAPPMYDQTSPAAWSSGGREPQVGGV